MRLAPIRLAVSALAAAAFAAAPSCQTQRPDPLPTDLGPPPSAAAVDAALAQLPADVMRPFALTLDISGRRYFATGTLLFRDAYDFRITTVTPAGNTFIDALHNWAGLTLFRVTPAISRQRATDLLMDLARGFRLPPSAEGLRPIGNLAAITSTDAREYTFVWTFASTGRLRTLNVAFNPFDQLEVQFRSHDAAGRPKVITFYRLWKDYALTLTFTD